VLRFLSSMIRCKNPLSSAPSRADLAWTLAAIVEMWWCRLAVAPETPPSIRCLEEDTPLTPPLPEKPLEPERHQTPPPPPSRYLIAGFPSVVSTVVSGQIGFLSSCRSRRKKSRRKCCTVARAWVLSSWWPWRRGGSVRPDRAEVEGKLLSRRILDGRSKLE
jgi:hypothetical protein